MQFLPTRLPIIVLWRVEAQFPALREMIMSAMCLCAEKRILSSYCEDMNGLKNNYFFLGILCHLSFCVVSDFKDDFIYSYALMHFVPLVALA
jgi:hypothetical protein